MCEDPERHGRGGLWEALPVRAGRPAQGYPHQGGEDFCPNFPGKDDI